MVLVQLISSNSSYSPSNKKSSDDEIPQFQYYNNKHKLQNQFTHESVAKQNDSPCWNFFSGGRTLRELAHDCASVLIQTQWRRYKNVSNYTRQKENNQREQKQELLLSIRLKSIVYLQAMWRGFLGRKLSRYMRSQKNQNTNEGKIHKSECTSSGEKINSSSSLLPLPPKLLSEGKNVSFPDGLDKTSTREEVVSVACRQILNKWNSIPVTLNGVEIVNLFDVLEFFPRGPNKQNRIMAFQSAAETIFDDDAQELYTMDNINTKLLNACGNVNQQYSDSEDSHQREMLRIESVEVLKRQNTPNSRLSSTAFPLNQDPLDLSSNSAFSLPLDQTLKCFGKALGNTWESIESRVIQMKRRKMAGKVLSNKTKATESTKKFSRIPSGNTVSNKKTKNPRKSSLSKKVSSSTGTSKRKQQKQKSRKVISTENSRLAKKYLVESSSIPQKARDFIVCNSNLTSYSLEQISSFLSHLLGKSNSSVIMRVIEDLRSSAGNNTTSSDHSTSLILQACQECLQYVECSLLLRRRILLSYDVLMLVIQWESAIEYDKVLCVTDQVEISAPLHNTLIQDLRASMSELRNELGQKNDEIISMRKEIKRLRHELSTEKNTHDEENPGNNIGITDSQMNDKDSNPSKFSNTPWVLSPPLPEKQKYPKEEHAIHKDVKLNNTKKTQVKTIDINFGLNNDSQKAQERNIGIDNKENLYTRNYCKNRTRSPYLSTMNLVNNKNKRVSKGDNSSRIHTAESKKHWATSSLNYSMSSKHKSTIKNPRPTSSSSTSSLRKNPKLFGDHEIINDSCFNFDQSIPISEFDSVSKTEDETCGIGDSKLHEKLNEIHTSTEKSEAKLNSLLERLRTKSMKEKYNKGDNIYASSRSAKDIESEASKMHRQRQEYIQNIEAKLGLI